MSFKQDYDDKTGLLVIQGENGNLYEVWTKGKQGPLWDQDEVLGLQAAARYFGLDENAGPSVSKWVTTGLLSKYGSSLRPYVFKVPELDRFKRERPDLILDAKNRIRRDRSSV